MHEHAQDLGSTEQLELVDDLLKRGNGAARQVVVFEANHDLREVVGEILDIELSESQPFKADSGAVLRMPVAPGIARRGTVRSSSVFQSASAWQG